MSGNINMPLAMAQERALALNRQMYLEQFRMSLAKDLQQMFLARPVLGPTEEEWKGAEEADPESTAVTAVSHANALMNALGFKIAKPQVEQ